MAGSPWGVVFVVWLTLAVAFGLYFSFPVFLVPLIEEFRWSRALTAGAFSISTITQGVISPVVGGLVDRFGARRIILGGAVLLGTAFILASRIQALWQLYAVTGVLAALGLGAMGWVPSGALLSRWVSHHRGRMIGLAFSGMGVGVLAVSPLTQWLIARVGWRQANLYLGAGALAVLLPLVWFGVREPRSAPAPAGPRADPASASRGVSVREALSTRGFWALFFAYFFTPLAVFPVVTHQVAFAIDLGFSAMFVAGIFGLAGLMSSVGRVAFGTISDRAGPPLAATLSFICTAGGTATLLVLPYWPHRGWLYAYGLLFGLGFGARGPIITAVASSRFGGQRFGMIYGLLNLGNGMGAAIGPWFGGAVFDATGSYRAAFLAAIGCCGLASACFWVAGARSKT